MRHLATDLIYLAVLIRAISWHQENGPIQVHTWILIGMFGLLLLTERTITQVYRRHPFFYIIVQSVLVITMMYSAPTIDFVNLLFLPLSFQAVWFFQKKIGYLIIAGYSLSMIGLLFLGLEWEVGLTMLLATTGADLLIGTFARLMADTETARAENQRLYASLKDSYQKLKYSASQAQSQAAVNQRHDLVRDLHDSLAQVLFSMNLTAQAAQMTAPGESLRVDAHLARLEDLTRLAVSEVVQLKNQQTTPMETADRIQGHGRNPENLLTALQKLVDERFQLDGLTVDLRINGHRVLSTVTQATLFRIIQESLNNIVRHAGVRHAIVTLDWDLPVASVQIEDHGLGFNSDDPQIKHGFGLSSMAEQAREIGWQFEVRSQAGHGTQVIIKEAAS